MKFFFLLFLLSFFSSRIWAQSVYDTEQDDEIQVTLYSNSGAAAFNLYEWTSSSTGDSRIHKVYIPLGTETGGGTNLDNRKFSFYENRQHLPLIQGDTIARGVSYLRFSLTIDATDDDHYLYVAVSSESSPTTYTILGDVAPLDVGDSEISYDLDFNDLCGVDDDIFDCGKFDSTTDPSDQDDISLFFFLSDNDGLSSSNTISSTSVSGVGYKLFLSTKVYDSLSIELNSLSKGDGQLIADIDGFSMGDFFEDIYALVGTSSCSEDHTSEQALGDLSAGYSRLRSMEVDSYDGELRIKSLTNGTCYSIRLFECDKFGFCSYGTDQLAETPEKIEALLEKQACFFLTAGFGGEHPVVTFFQHWRDHFLRKSLWGRHFIKWYYHSAPQYTPYILERPWLQKVVRVLAYFLYAGVRGWWFFSSLFLCFFFLFLWKVGQRRRKIKL